MNISVLASQYKYYGEYDTTLLQTRISEKLGLCVSALSHEFVYPLHMLLENVPCSYWDADVAKQVISQLDFFFSQEPSRMLTCWKRNISVFQASKRENIASEMFKKPV